MKAAKSAIAPAKSQFCLEAESFMERLIREVDDLNQQKLKLESASKSTRTIRQKIGRLIENIEDNQNKISEVEKMLTLTVGSTVVRLGTKKPGTIAQLKIAHRIPEVHVIWEGASVQVPERPHNLSLIDPTQLEYFWHGTEDPIALKRKLDLSQPEDWSTLLAFYNECDENATTRKTYLKQRFNSLASRTFLPQMHVVIGEINGTVLPVKKWKSDKKTGFYQIAIELDYGATIFRNPAEIKLAPNQKTAKQTNNVISFLKHKSNPDSDTPRNTRRSIEDVPVNLIRRDGGTQQRIALNHEAVTEYAEAMKRGDKFPPIKLKYDGIDYWLTDGFHITEAAFINSWETITAEVTIGTLRDAILESVGVNALHGLRRSNSDKRKAVTTLLEDSEWCKWSNREIAKRCKVSHSFVNKIRDNLTGNVSSEKRIYQDKHGNISKMNTENIGFRVSQDNQKALLNNDGELINQFGKKFNPDDIDRPLPDSYYPDKNGTVSINCPDNDSTVRVSNDQLVKQFEIGQLVRIKSDRSDSSLFRYNQNLATIININTASVNLKMFGCYFDNVLPDEIEIVEEKDLTLCVPISAKDYARLCLGFENKRAIASAALSNTDPLQELINAKTIIEPKIFDN